MVSLLLNARKMLSPFLYFFAYMSKQFTSKKEHDINTHLEAGAALLG
jgi:hypothetical protein